MILRGQLILAYQGLCKASDDAAFIKEELMRSGSSPFDFPKDEVRKLHDLIIVLDKAIASLEPFIIEG